MNNLVKILLIALAIIIEGLVIKYALFDSLLPLVSNDIAKNVLMIGIPLATLIGDVIVIFKTF